MGRPRVAGTPGDRMDRRAAESAGKRQFGEVHALAHDPLEVAEAFDDVDVFAEQMLCAGQCGGGVARLANCAPDGVTYV